jgi:hypothetical protein
MAIRGFFNPDFLKIRLLTGWMDLIEMRAKIGCFGPKMTKNASKSNKNQKNCKNRDSRKLLFPFLDPFYVAPVFGVNPNQFPIFNE